MGPFRKLLVGAAALLVFDQSFSHLRIDRAGHNHVSPSIATPLNNHKNNRSNDDLGALLKMDPKTAYASSDLTPPVVVLSNATTTALDSSEVLNEPALQQQIVRPRSALNEATNSSSSAKETKPEASNLNGTTKISSDPCVVLLATFPNSGTTITQAIFKSSTGIYSEAVYREGPKTPWGTYLHNVKKNDPNAARIAEPGECRLVKTHAMVPYKKLPQTYQRVVVLYRDTVDNFQANIRYLHKNKHFAKYVAPQCGNGTHIDPENYNKLRKFHEMAHRRWYCHAQSYQQKTGIPTQIQTYSSILQHPQNAFQEILKFVGYPHANISHALTQNPIVPHNIQGDLQYKPINETKCHKVNIQFREIWRNITRGCRNAFAKPLLI